MMMLADAQTHPVITAVGWTLVHFLWQGTLIAMLVAPILAAARRRSPNVRYLISAGGMVLMLLAPVATVVILLMRGSPGTAGVAASFAAVTEAPLPARIAPALPALTLTWLAGVCALQLRVLVLWGRARRLGRCGTGPLPEGFAAMTLELMRRLEIHRHVRVLESSCAAVPMVIGWLRPVVLVPTAALLNLSPGELRMVMAHELAHVRRHDFLVNLLQALLECLLFYHPAVWWLSARMRDEREYCCDDLAVGVCGDAVGLARALASLDSLRDDRPLPAVASTGGFLMNRICRLLGAQHRSPRRISGSLLLAGVATVGLTVLTFTVAVSADADAPKQRAELPIVEESEVVAIMNQLQLGDADLAATLADAGIDGESILEMLPWFGVEPSQVDQIRRAAIVHRSLRARVSKAHADIERARKTGAITDVEATMRLEKLHHAAHQHLQGVLGEHGDEQRVMLKRKPGHPGEAVAYVDRQIAHLDMALGKLQAAVAAARARIDDGDDSPNAQRRLKELAVKLRAVEDQEQAAADVRQKIVRLVADGASTQEVHEILAGMHSKRRVKPERADTGQTRLADLDTARREIEHHRKVILKKVAEGTLDENTAADALARTRMKLVELDRVREVIIREIEVGLADAGGSRHRLKQRAARTGGEPAVTQIQSPPEHLHHQMRVLHELQMQQQRLVEARAAGELTDRELEAELARIEYQTAALERKLAEEELHVDGPR